MIGLTSCAKRVGGQWARCVPLVSLGGTYKKVTPFGSADLPFLPLMAGISWPVSPCIQAFARGVDGKLRARLRIYTWASDTAARMPSGVTRFLFRLVLEDE